MTGQTIVLSTAGSRSVARALVDRAPPMAVLNIREARRTTDQNDLLWALLSDVSRAKPEGRCHTPDVWKAIFMHAAGHAVQFGLGLDGQPFPLGFRSSRLTKAQMSDLIEYIYAYGAQHNVEHHDNETGMVRIERLTNGRKIG